jgi:hypothetical protein
VCLCVGTVCRFGDRGRGPPHRRRRRLPSTLEEVAARAHGCGDGRQVGEGGTGSGAHCIPRHGRNVLIWPREARHGRKGSGLTRRARRPDRVRFAVNRSKPPVARLSAGVDGRRPNDACNQRSGFCLTRKINDSLGDRRSPFSQNRKRWATPGARSRTSFGGLYTETATFISIPCSNAIT